MASSPSNADGVSAVPAASGSADYAFIGRQPIVNDEQQLVAYELLFRGAQQSAGARVTDGSQATSRLLINAFNNFGVERVLGDKRAFVNVTAHLLESDVVDLLPRERVVLEILEDVAPTPAVVERCRRLREAGYQLALDDFVYRPEYEPLLELAHYVKLDVRALGPAGIAAQVGLSRRHGAWLLAEKVETREEFRACRELSIEYYQGYFFAQPETLSTKRVDPTAQRVIYLFNLVVGDADQKVVEREFRQDVTLSYNLLRYINSVGFGLMNKVRSIQHALVILGRAKLARWLSLLMMSGVQSTVPQALFRTALVRARLTELLGGRRLPPPDHDLLFMLGMFSLLDALLDQPLADVLAALRLPEAVTGALLRNEGKLAPYLQMALACERDDLECLERLAPQHDLKVADISGAHLEALGWAEQVGAAV
jgi:EAL and modified HD-GYP domain-containing signal transduction protein